MQDAHKLDIKAFHLNKQTKNVIKISENALILTIYTPL